MANPEGTGRDDLGIEILTAAENVTRKVSATQSKAVRNLAEKIKKTFGDLRSLFRKYESNIEVVDPQLKNNPDLVEMLYAYETSWEKGKNWLVEPKKCH